MVERPGTIGTQGILRKLSRSEFLSYFVCGQRENRKVMQRSMLEQAAWARSSAMVGSCHHNIISARHACTSQRQRQGNAIRPRMACRGPMLVDLQEQGRGPSRCSYRSLNRPASRRGPWSPLPSADPRYLLSDTVGRGRRDGY